MYMVRDIRQAPGLDGMRMFEYLGEAVKYRDEMLWKLRGELRVEQVWDMENEIPSWVTIERKSV